MKILLCSCVSLLVCAVSVWGLSCGSWGTGCNEKVAARLKCLHGVAILPCNRCECAKGLNMPCGGPWNITGKCGLGLVCNKDWADFNSDGICVNASTLALPLDDRKEP
ncbi:venom protein 302-like [Penaeus japonicus]|uniref:venom protein 302-like n=1 Tax=Penaeus japonicus TaxID=27405 RepID=UPI001C714505|nr:venom protein 302-like [Penaeus japonicus]